MNNSWLTGILALLGGAAGASLPPFIGRIFQRQDQRRQDLAALSLALTEWETAHSRAMSAMIMGVSTPDRRDEALKDLKELNLHAANKELARARFLAASTIPDAISFIDQVNTLDNAVGRVFGESITKTGTAYENFSKIYEISSNRADLLKNIHDRIHTEVSKLARKPK